MQDQPSLGLVNRCAVERDAELWREFVDRYGHRLAAGVRRALRRCGARVGREERQDLLQEVYLRLLDKQGHRLRRCQGRGDRAVGAYLSKIAESAVFDHLRAEAAAKRGRGCLVEGAGDGDEDPFEGAVGPGPSPEEMLLSRERRRLFLGHCRNALSARHKRRDLRDIQELCACREWGGFHERTARYIRHYICGLDMFVQFLGHVPRGCIPRQP